MDLLVIETQFDLNEAARRAARGAIGHRPARGVFLQLRPRDAHDDGRQPGADGGCLRRPGVAALGINCGRSLEDNLKALEELRAATDLPIWFKPNAGLPRSRPGRKAPFDVQPAAMGAAPPPGSPPARPWWAAAAAPLPTSRSHRAGGQTA